MLFVFRFSNLYILIFNCDIGNFQRRVELLLSCLMNVPELTPAQIDVLVQRAVILRKVRFLSLFLVGIVLIVITVIIITVIIITTIITKLNCYC